MCVIIIVTIYISDIQWMKIKIIIINESIIRFVYDLYGYCFDIIDRYKCYIYKCTNNVFIYRQTIIRQEYWHIFVPRNKVSKSH